MLDRYHAVLLACGMMFAAPAVTQPRVNGVIEQRGFLGTKVIPDAIKVFLGSEFKGAHRVAIAWFAGAFPSENHFFAAARGGGLGALMGGAAKAYMVTSMSGVDHATQQLITDKAFALFKAQLTAAGDEVVDRAELSAAAPEYATWTPVPSFSEGRFGTYVAPDGKLLFWNQTDTAKRDTSGMFGTQNAIFRLGDSPVLYKRSQYVAHDGKVGIITVTLVVDYGLNSSNGEIKYGKAKVGFVPGVNIGAGSTIDRGSSLDTIIGAGSRLDNLVQVGHNVKLGRCCVIVSQAGISGSTVLEDFVVVAAQAGLTGHLRIGAKARIGAQAGVMRNVDAGADVVGSPAMPVREFFRNVAVLRRLARRPTAGAV